MLTVQACAIRARRMLAWDVSNGVARRCWAGNANARQAIEQTMHTSDGQLRVTLPHVADEQCVNDAVKNTF
jgi:urocanate hydratase